MFLPIAHVGGGVFEPLQLLPAFAALAGYAIRARTLARQGRPVPPLRMASFGLGIGLIVAALASPVSHIGGELILAHMAQHLLMADLGALLIVLGLTGPLLQPLLALPVIGKLRVFAHPVVAFSLWAIDLYVWHLPFMYQGALNSEARARAAAHELRLLRDRHVVRAARPAAAAGLVRQRRQGDLRGRGAADRGAAGQRLPLGRAWCSTPTTAPARRSGTCRALEDQSIAGTLMMVEGSIVTIVLLGWLFLKTAREGEERQELLEYAQAHGVPLDERRAARAVGAGRGEELRRRLERQRRRER